MCHVVFVSAPPSIPFDLPFHFAPPPPGRTESDFPNAYFYHRAYHRTNIRIRSPPTNNVLYYIRTRIKHYTPPLGVPVGFNLGNARTKLLTSRHRLCVCTLYYIYFDYVPSWTRCVHAVGAEIKINLYAILWIRIILWSLIKARLQIVSKFFFSEKSIFQKFYPLRFCLFLKIIQGHIKKNYII